MQKNLQCFTLTAACILLAASTGVIPVSANSAQRYWQGISATGSIITDEACPIVVEHELLTFDIQEFPREHYSDTDSYLAYNGQVTAEYSFYNPADYTVTATLLFPLGNTPAYGYLYDSDGDLSQRAQDATGFDITVNGSVIEKKLRHSLSYSYEQFELETDLARLAEGFLQDDFYRPDLSVTEYTYRVDGVDLEAFPAANAAFDVFCDGSLTRIYFPDQSGCTQKDGTLRISDWVVENGETMTVYAIGEPLDALPDWKFYQDGGATNGDEISGSMTLTGTRSLTFQELALMNFRSENGISESDWYNAVVLMLDSGIYGEGSPVAATDLLYNPGLTPDLMGWYQYEITLKPGEHVVNTVTAPMYPSIDISFSPARYSYTYLLSPAKTWTQFGELEVVLNTPYYLLESSIGGFTKTQTGYSLTLSGLPEEELTFDLCSSEHPKNEQTSYEISFFLRWILPVALALLFLGLCLFLLILYHKHTRGKKG